MRAQMPRIPEVLLICGYSCKALPLRLITLVAMGSMHVCMGGSGRITARASCETHTHTPSAGASRHERRAVDVPPLHSAWFGSRIRLEASITPFVWGACGKKVDQGTHWMKA